MPTSIISALGQQRVLQYLDECLKLPGDVIECGVYQGGLATDFALAIQAKKLSKLVYAADSFIGLPDATDHDNYHKRGDFADTSLAACKKVWKSAKVDGIVIPTVGFFADTLPKIKLVKGYCFAFIDADLYESTTEAIEHVWPRLQPGGWMLFDDYNWEHTEGVTRAIDEFIVFEETLNLVKINDHIVGVQK